MSQPANPQVAIARYVLGTADDVEAAHVAELLEWRAGADGPTDPLPTPEQAAWVVLEELIGEIAHGEVEPEAGLGRVIDEVFRSAGLAGVRRGRMGESHNAARLVALQDEYEDMARYERRSGTTDRRRMQVDSQVVALAVDWMAGNATGRVR